MKDSSPEVDGIGMAFDDIRRVQPTRRGEGRMYGHAHFAAVLNSFFYLKEHIERTDVRML